MADYTIFLRTLSTSANIADNVADAHILSVIRTNTDDHETRMKCLDETTHTNLIEWRKKHDLKNSCASLMEATKGQPILSIELLVDRIQINWIQKIQFSQMLSLRLQLLQRKAKHELHANVSIIWHLFVEMVDATTEILIDQITHTEINHVTIRDGNFNLI